MKINKSALTMSCIFLFLGLMMTKQYLLTNAVTLRRWMYSDGGLVMYGWQALIAICLMFAVGVYGLFMVWKNIDKEP